MRTWDEEAGWGVIDSEDTPGGCWALFAEVLVPGYRALTPGQQVEFEARVASQEGYEFVAERITPSGSADLPPPRSNQGGEGYRSELGFTCDPEP